MIKKTVWQIAGMIGGTVAACGGARPGATAAVAAPATGEERICGVSTDTRTLRPGNLFVPLAGERFDGHAYVADAFAKGAGAALWQEDRGTPPAGKPVIVVADTLAALQKLAAAYRAELPVRIVGVTGSNGKTTTKDLTAAALEASFKVQKTVGNLNNHIGLPLTLLELDEDTDVAVVEMGMSGRGEIALLSRLAKPDVAIITNIGEAHLQQLGSRREIARAKLEILQGMAGGGLLALNGDDPLLEQELRGSALPPGVRLCRFGLEAHNDLRAEDVEPEDDGVRFRTNVTGETEWFVPVPGKHNAVNALAAVAAALHFGADPKAAANRLGSAQTTGMRLERLRAACGALLINDSYNASPSSMRAAIDYFYALGGVKRKIAVLGDMLELGPDESRYHRELGEQLDGGEIDWLITYGPLAAEIAAGAAGRLAPDRIRSFVDKTALIDELKRLVREGDAVLFKASRGMQLEEAVFALQQI